jgi:glycosyltransferase involved in cell wall biosynthesis
MEIKVGIDIRDLRIAQTGAKTYLTELIKAWEAMPNTSLVLIDNHLKVYRGSSKLLKIIEHIRFQWWKQIQLPLMAKQKGCTHLLCTDFFVPYFKGQLKTIAVLHDAFFWESPEHYNSLWLQLFHFIGVPAAKKANLVVVPSHYAKQRILHYENFDPSKLVVVYEAAKKYDNNQTQAIQKIESNLLAKSSAPYFLHIGVLEKRKNLPVLIKAFSIVLKKYPQYELVLAGNTPVKKQLNDAPAIMAAIQEEQVSKKVKLVGYVNSPVAATLYENAFAYVFPSLNEGFGLPLVEAFSFGLPVICSNSSALPEIAADAALLVNMNDANNKDNVNALANAMIKLIETEDLQKQFKEKGLERNKDFSWQQTATQIIEHIKNI